MGVKAKCRNCGREADSESFKLHYKYRMMVCPDCFTGRHDKEKEAKRVEAQSKPAGWDKEDEYLEKMYQMKKRERAEKEQNITPIAGSDQVQYVCLNCKYKFKYNPYKKIPANCPYCNLQIPPMRTGMF